MRWMWVALVFAACPDSPEFQGSTDATAATEVGTDAATEVGTDAVTEAGTDVDVADETTPIEEFPSIVDCSDGSVCGPGRHCEVTRCVCDEAACDMPVAEDLRDEDAAIDAFDGPFSPFVCYADESGIALRRYTSGVGWLQFATSNVLDHVPFAAAADVRPHAVIGTRDATGDIAVYWQDDDGDLLELDDEGLKCLDADLTMDPANDHLVVGCMAFDRSQVTFHGAELEIFPLEPLPIPPLPVDTLNDARSYAHWVAAPDRLWATTVVANEQHFTVSAGTNSIGGWNMWSEDRQAPAGHDTPLAVITVVDATPHLFVLYQRDAATVLGHWHNVSQEWVPDDDVPSEPLGLRELRAGQGLLGPHLLQVHGDRLVWDLVGVDDFAHAELQLADDLEQVALAPSSLDAVLVFYTTKRGELRAWSPRFQ